MSDPKVKPSIAARELAEALFPDFTPEIHVRYADIIEFHVRDLLECLNEQTCSINCEHADCNKIHATIAPWKTTI